VIIFDQCELSREGLARLFGDKPGFDVVATCREHSHLIETASTTQPDLVIIMNGSPSVDARGMIRAFAESSPLTKVVVLADKPGHGDVWSAIEAGAAGYLSREEIGMGDFVASIELLMRGIVVISEDVARRLVQGLVPAGNGIGAMTGNAQMDSLSKREKEIVTLVSTGATNGEIAKSLFLQESTVKVHMRNILEKLRFRNRQQVVAFAVSQDPSRGLQLNQGSSAGACASLDSLRQIHESPRRPPLPGPGPVLRARLSSTARSSERRHKDISSSKRVVCR
jgi:two-component system nitrate/nitrite response regulator NarL